MYNIFSSCFFLLVSLFLLGACTSVQNEAVLLREQVQEKREEFRKDKNIIGKIRSTQAPDRLEGTPSGTLEYTYEFIIEGLDSGETKTGDSRKNEANEANDANDANEANDEKNAIHNKNDINNATNNKQSSPDTQNANKSNKLSRSQVEELKKEIISLLLKNSQLEFLKNKNIASIVALERRASNDVANAIEVMEAFGFYSSSAQFEIDETTQPYKVFLYLTPNEQYLVDDIKIKYLQPDEIPRSFLNKEKKTGFLYKKRAKTYLFEFPSALDDIAKGDKAIALDIINAADTFGDSFRENGFPEAKVVSSAYTVNKNTHKLSGFISINQGFPAFMGAVVVSGNEKVSSKYLQDLCPWKYGDVWDDRKLLDYRNALQRTGLFQNVDLRFDKKAYNKYRKTIRKNKKNKNSETLEPVILPVFLTVEESTLRSFSGALFFSTDRGPGVNVSWKHKNFFGNGEKLDLKLPISRDETLFTAALTKPAFIFPEQNLIFKGSGGYEKTDAYEKDFVDIAAGLEREIRKDWRIESLFHIDRVIPKNTADELAYYSLRWANTIRYDKRNNRENPTKGYVVVTKISPLIGYDDSRFHSMAMEFDASAYYSLTDNVLMAFRLGLGLMPGSSWGRIPRTKRFFLGGGGTVRGFAYQELGPHDAEGDALGGLAYTLMNIEARIKITKEIAIVPFLDGGMVYTDMTPDWGQALAWGTGIGLRYATPVGPVRLDVAVPLTGPNLTAKKSLSDFQLYISLGQAF